jgi:hypothetical protein
MITNGRKYVINENAGIFLDVTRVPEDLQALPGDDYILTKGLAIGLQVNLCDSDVPVTLCLTDADARGLIKAIKMTRKKFRKENKAKW